MNLSLHQLKAYNHISAECSYKRTNGLLINI